MYIVLSFSKIIVLHILHETDVKNNRWKFTLIGEVSGWGRERRMDEEQRKEEHVGRLIRNRSVWLRPLCLNHLICNFQNTCLLNSLSLSLSTYIYIYIDNKQSSSSRIRVFRNRYSIQMDEAAMHRVVATGPINGFLRKARARNMKSIFLSLSLSQYRSVMVQRSTADSCLLCQ
jgi:hypothetical protein